MQLPEKGLDPTRALATLEAFKADDLDWRRMRTWAYVYPAGRSVEEVGKRAYTAYLTENALDPTVFPSVMALENQLTALAAEHLHAGPEAAGNFTSGGTESILLAVKTARDRALARDPDLERPQIVLPVTAHAAFHKAARYFQLDTVLVEVDPVTFRATADRMAEAITDRTILLVGSAPSYAHGVVDDIEGLGRLALEHDLLLHVDACVGGWLMPFFRELGRDIPPFDFAVPGVTSMSMDLHKYAFCPKGASLVLYRDARLREHQIFSCSDWTGYTVINPTVQSTRSGGPVAAAWAVMHHLGRQGYRERARAILDAVTTIRRGIGAIDGIEVMGDPDFSLVAFTSDTVNVFHIADEMRRRGWYIQPQLGYGDHPANVHISVTPGVAPQAEPMIADLAEAVRAAAALPETDLAARARAIVNTLEPGRLSDEAFTKLLELAGIHGADLPDRMAGINEILQALPVQTNEALLARFFGDLNRLTDEQRDLLESVRVAMGAADGPTADRPHDDPTISGLHLRRTLKDRAARSLRTASRVAVGLATLGHRAAAGLEG